MRRKLPKSNKSRRARQRTKLKEKKKLMLLRLWKALRCPNSHPTERSSWSKALHPEPTSTSLCPSTMRTLLQLQKREPEVAHELSFPARQKIGIRPCLLLWSLIFNPDAPPQCLPLYCGMYTRSQIPS